MSAEGSRETREWAFRPTRWEGKAGAHRPSVLGRAEAKRAAVEAQGMEGEEGYGVMWYQRRGKITGCSIQAQRERKPGDMQDLDEYATTAVMQHRGSESKNRQGTVDDG